MLKRLELIGFKSFAEKTQFDFGPGVTAIVGPNGSGKSNVVDAARWILGEQSAKSLRGGEMTDVIFNGSATRRSLGMAEVSITLDNSRRLLAVDADEVQVARRVYRGGEGEYLINKQPARLKDIKDMFLGSGAGADAYCVIEQGRVDVLLQASARERRTIFEEAAGISRFKARKIETLRKLEQVEQNLVRLRDIIEEVDRQLRSVKQQAAKAQRYQEYLGRLKELRVGLGLDECHRLTLQSQDVTATLDDLRARLADQTAQTAKCDTELERLDRALADVATAERGAGSVLAVARQSIAAEEATLQHERSLVKNLEEEIGQVRAEVQALHEHLAGMAGAAEHDADEVAAVEAACIASRQSTEEFETSVQQTQARLAALRERVQTDKVELLEQMRQAARVHNEKVSLDAQDTGLRQHRKRLQQKATVAADSLARVDGEVQALVEAAERLQVQIGAARQKQAEVREQRDQTREAVETVNRRLVGLREERSAVTSRLEVIQALEQNHEGISPGVREVLTLAARPEPGPWRTVVGVVADLITVGRESASLVELALGERAHHVVVRDAALLMDALAGLEQPFSGRVSFLPVSEGNTSPVPICAAATAAADLATCEHHGLADLPHRLLRSTVVVPDLAAARAMSAGLSGYRYLTPRGELLEADGTLTVGPASSAGGLLSRKSELRALREQAGALDHRITDTEKELADLRERLGALDVLDEQAQQECQVLTAQTADLRSRLVQQRERHEGFAQEIQLGQVEMKQLDEELAALECARQNAVADTQAAETMVQQLQRGLQDAETETAALEQERERTKEACAAARVELAKAEERRDAVAARRQQAQREWEERQADERRQQERLATLGARLDQSQETMLRSSATLAQAYVDKEAAEHETRHWEQEAARLRGERQRHLDQAQAARQDLQALQEQVHARELEASDLRHRLDAIAARLREEHELDLAELYRSYQPPAQPLDQTTAQEEIAELKRKIGRLGNVSLDSLQELQELETRSKTLQAQHDDLTAAKASLDEIIFKINHDSRKLFHETLASVRGHFQDLFRRLFGGGMADIVLEDENDILECGIEIVARPPGKELRSISLLSGGEKTLTAVALLLAIFRSKPSPFCILDEVDAALDEANIGRFAAVLRDFLDQSQFIMITHSKKTMAAADVLYGVTMQESGVSKRVAVRLEDWPEDGADSHSDESHRRAA